MNKDCEALDVDVAICVCESYISCSRWGGDKVSIDVCSGFFSGDDACATGEEHKKECREEATGGEHGEETCWTTRTSPGSWTKWSIFIRRHTV